MEYLNPNNTLPSFVDNFHNKFEVPVIGINDAYYVNCDKSSSGYSKKDDKKEKDIYPNMEEKAEEVEELGSHGQLCKCGSNSEICEEFINSFSLQDILSNFELPLSSSTDEDDETSFNNKKSEDEEELNLVDFLNNTQFLNDFVNRNSIKLDKVCINSDKVDLLTKNNRKKRNNAEDNHQILYDNQSKASDNQFCNPETENEEDNQNKLLKNGENDIIHNEGQAIFVEERRHFISDDSSSELSVHSEEESQNSICANHRVTMLDPTSTIPLPSFDTFKSKNLTSQFSTAEDRSCIRIKDNKNVPLNKCMEMFQKYQSFHEKSSPGSGNNTSVDNNPQLIMEHKINEQINEFESFSGVLNILEDVMSNSQDNVVFSDKEKKQDPSEIDSCSKSEQQNSTNLAIQDSLNLTKNFSVLDNCVQTENHETIGKLVKENSAHRMICTKNTKSTTSKCRMNQFEEVIDSGNFWINKNTDVNNQNVPIAKDSVISENPSLLRNANKDNFKVPISNGKIVSVHGSEGDENNMRKSVKILTKTHLLNSMQFDKNQRNFMNSPHFLLLLTQPMKFPNLEEQYCSKNLSIDTKTKLISLQNNIRSQMRNAQLSIKKCKPNMKDSESPILFPEVSKLHFNRNDQIKNSVSDVNSLSTKYENSQEFNQKDIQNIDCVGSSNNLQRHNEPSLTNCKELSTLISKTENFRFDQEFKILTLRTENADCINKKIKPRNFTSTLESQVEWKPVSINIKDKIKPKDDKILHQKNCITNDNPHGHHFYYQHRNKREVENDPLLRRSERIRVKKYNIRMKSCLLSNAKKSKKGFVKKCVSMSLVDQILRLRNESDKSQCHDTNHIIDEIYDLKTYKSSFIQEETLCGQKIKRLRYISNNSIVNQSILSKKDSENNKSCESKEVSYQIIADSPNISETKGITKTVELKSICVGENIKKDPQKISPSLKSKYPTLEALIASTSNEQKPIIRKRKRVKFDKSKYEKIKKINKEKENNIEQNKILLLNMNKNIQNKVMQNLLLVRDRNNKTHLLFTKPIENDKVKVTTEGNITTEKETLIKSSENNPNYINKKIEEMIRDMVLHKNLQQNKCNEQSSAKELNSDTLLTLVDIKSTREPNMDLQNSLNVHIVNKCDSNNMKIPKIHDTVTHKSSFATEILTNSKCPSNNYEFHTMVQENNVTYTENIITDEIRFSKRFQIENYFGDTSENNQFSTAKKSSSGLNYDKNSIIDEKNNSIISSMGNKTSYHMSNKLMKELNANREYKNSEKNLEGDFNQIFATNFTGQSNVTSLWQSEDIDYNIDEMIVPNVPNNATNKNEKVPTSNQFCTHLEYTKNSDTFQNISNAQSRTYEDQIVSSNIPQQAFIGKGALNMPEMNGMVESLPSVSGNENVFLENMGSKTNVSKSSMTFEARNTIQTSESVQNEGFGIYGSEEMCWNSLSSAEWTNSKFEENVQPTSSNDDVYVEHLDLSEEIMQKSLQEDEKILEKEKLHVCTIEDCNSVFRTQAEWEAHARMHAVQRPFGCRYCDKAFKTSCDLSKHCATHNGDRPYKCNYSSCGRHFRTHTQRQLHERCHLDAKPYSCQVCGRTFISNTHKNNHLRIHYGLKPYVCHVEGCKRKFVDLSSLKKHTKIHTQQTFFCNICNKTYKHQQSIITHYQEVHGVVVEDVSVYIRK